MEVQGYRIGLQSWCLRTYKTHEQVIEALNDAGLNAIELCGVHLDPANSEAVDEVLKLYRRHGIAITSFGIAHFPNDEQAVRPFFEFAVKAGFPTLGADPDPEAIDLLEGLCNEYNVRLGVHNHGLRHRWGDPEVLEELFGRTSSNFGLCLDTGWMLDSKVDPVHAVQRFADRLYGIHIKDFLIKDDGTVVDVVVGLGNLDLNALFMQMLKIEFDGYATLEYEGDEQNPVPSIRECVEQLQQVK